jgi:glycosyltransferase involved in cell wall biosynthesis
VENLFTNQRLRSKGGSAIATVTVLLPTLNEEHSIRATIRQIRKEMPGAIICVVDGLSTDRTVQIARDELAAVIMCEERGKAVAVATALKQIDTDYVVMADADL